MHTQLQAKLQGERKCPRGSLACRVLQIAIPLEMHIEDADGHGLSGPNSALTSIHSTCLGLVVCSLQGQSVWAGGGAEQGKVEEKDEV